MRASKNAYRVVAASVLFVCTWQNTHAAQVILGKGQPGGSGVEISGGGWSEAVHTDASYQAFHNVRNGKLGRYDYYYQLEIVPQFKDKFKTCDVNPNFGTFFRNLFGFSQAALVAVKVDVQYRWTTGIPVDFLKGDAGLVLAATGSSPANPAPGNGCFFDQTLRPTFPLLQYGGAGENDSFDDFVIKFIVNGGRSENLNLVSNVVNLFSKISAFVGWGAITAGISSAPFQAFQSAAQSFQTAMQQAGTLQNQVAVGYTLKASGGADDGRIELTIPELFGGNQSNGNMAIYVRRQASIALATADSSVTTSTVFDNLELPNRQCTPVNIAGGTCNANNDSIRVALAKVLKAVDPGLGDGTNPVIPLFDIGTPDRQKKIYQMCNGLRTVARLNMHLTTLDEALIRWAFGKEAGLLDALKDPVRSAALAKASGVNVAQLTDACWNAGDDQTLRGVAGKLNKSIQ